MKLDPVALLEAAVPEPARGVSTGARCGLVAVLIAISWVLAWHGDTARSMVLLWEQSETFAHGFLIVPISAWLIWRRRDELAALEPRPNFFALPLLALVGLGWLLGRLAGASVVQQFALIFMIPMVVWTILGTRFVWALAFPLFYLVFAVPFGEFLLPPLMEHTADFTIWALRLSGVPVYREGLFFTVPSGSWSVVEACSGLRYLIASITLGFLYAYLTYRSWARRAIFVAFSVLVPIVANWVRAYMIVMIGHLSGMKYAVGIDHLIYGWIFFGVVMLILFWVGSFWREDDLPHEAKPHPVVPALWPQASVTAIIAATLAAAAMAAVWPVAASRLEAAGNSSQPVLQAPQASAAWQPVAERLTDWVPRFFSPSAQTNQTYAADAGRVGLYLGYYRNQRQGAELISSRNTLIPTGDSSWASAGESRRTLNFNDAEVALIETKLRGASRQLLVWHLYWVDGQYMVNSYQAKFLQAKSKLFGGGDDGAVIIVYTELSGDGKVAAGRLQDFITAMLPAITTSLQNAR